MTEKRGVHIKGKGSLFLFLLLLFLMSGNLLSGQSFYISIRAEGSTEICRGDSVEARIHTIFFSGSPPYTVVINDNDGEYLILKEIELPYYFYLNPESDNTYYIASAEDSRGRKGRPYGSVDVQVYSPTPVEIVTDRTAFLVNEPPYPLVSSPSGAQFKGKGVSGSSFSPSEATPEGSPHRITCTYVNPYGCVSQGNTDFHVLYGEAGVALYSGDEVINSFCNDGTSFTIKGSSTDGLTGSFSIYREGTTDPVDGVIVDDDPDDNQAILMTTGLKGTYRIEFNSAFYELEISASTLITAYEAPQLEIGGAPDTACSENDPFPLFPVIDPPDPNPDYSFSGPGVTGNPSDGYFFDPAADEIVPGPNQITGQYTSADGCVSQATATILAGITPRVEFTLAQVCLDTDGGDISFINLTGNKDQVDTWSWNFGDPESGSSNFSDLESPEHYYGEPGPRTILLEAVSQEGCRSSFSLDTSLVLLPELIFSIGDICISSSGDTVSFFNHTVEKERIDAWDWDFGDPESGDANRSTLENPSHFYTVPGPRTVVLNALTPEGCLATREMDTILADHPLVNISWADDCFSTGLPNDFSASWQSEYSPIDTLSWSIRTYAGELLEEIGKEADQPDLSYSFPSHGTYQVALEGWSKAGCQGQAAKEVELIPLYRIADEDYLAGFDQTAEGWKPFSSDSLRSWTLGEPDFEGFSSTESDLAWYTDLPVQVADYLERSWVRSPCFDFTGVDKPVISLDLMRSFVPGMDGAVLQYRSEDDMEWKTLGSPGEGLNWYNDSSIVHMPGGSPLGWGLELFEPDRDWITARHPLDSVAGKSRVKWRIAIATGDSREVTPGAFNQGFAFDNFFLGEPVIRRSVLEYFTNASGDGIYRADTLVGNLGRKYEGLLYDLHYHMDYPKVDPMNAYNPTPPSTRAFNYGVPGVPYAILNGGISPEYRFDLAPSGSGINEEILQSSALETPLFDLSVFADYQADQLQGSAMVKCLAEEYASNLQLYIVVIEKEVTSYPDLSPDSSFRNVVLDMLPTPAGTLLGNGWQSGVESVTPFSWNYVPFLEDIDDLSVVAFLLDRDSGRILQADKLPKTPGVGIGEADPDYESLLVYPNPARDRLEIRFGYPPENRGTLVLVDLSGQEVWHRHLAPGTSSCQVDVSPLQGGWYLLLWKEPGRVKARAKVILHR